MLLVWGALPRQHLVAFAASETAENGKLLVRVSGRVVAGIFLREDRVEQLNPASVPVILRSQPGVAGGRATRVDSSSPQETMPEAIER
jgi:hypothetical protein